MNFRDILMASACGGGGGPSLSLDFLSGSLDNRITFTRGSNATLTDSTGKVTYAPSNLLTYSEDIANAAWTKSTASVTANDTQAPNGTTTADKVIATSIGSARGVYAGVTTAAAAYTISVYAKSSGLNWLCIYDPAGSATGAAWFNLATGAIGTVASGYSAAIINVGNGWYRCAITKTLTASTNYAFFGGVDGDNSATVTSTTSGIYVWGAQLEPVTYQTTPGTYVATTSSAYYGPRFDYDPVTLAPKGLLIEEVRANLLTYSSDWTNAAWSKTNITVTAAATTSPDGTVNAQKLTATAAAATVINSTPVAVAATSATYSIYVKQGTGATTANLFILRNSTTATLLIAGTLNYSTGVWTYSTGSTGVTVANVGSGWWRLQITATAGITSGDLLHGYIGWGGAVAAAGDFLYAYGAQLEAGAFATSYIPTVASTVTRSADVATMTGTNFSSWYNQSAGTFVSSLGTLGDILSSYAFAARDAGLTNTVGVDIDAAGTIRLRVTDNSINQALVSMVTTATTNTVYKVAGAYNANDFAAVANGGTVSTDTAGTVPTNNTFFAIGSASTTGSTSFNGHIRQIAYFNTRLPNAQLQSLTA